jgi:coproporphyrinogen III oxidase
MAKVENQKKIASAWFAKLRDEICVAFEIIENSVNGADEIMALSPGRFVQKNWERPEGREESGGGVMSIMHGRVFEKVGVNVSTVFGEFSKQFRASVPGAKEDPRFWASGISVVAHPRSPHVPIAHMNSRMIVTTKQWFGGGGDLTPIFANELDTEEFHKALQLACNTHDKEYYTKFKKWCDEYFYLPHRNEIRGVGGIFYDNLNTNNWDADLAFTQDVGISFKNAYTNIVNRHMNKEWSDEDKHTQLIKRGRYVEFNLIHDRGTKFGLMTNGNTEAILMSLPPVAAWQ